MIHICHVFDRTAGWEQRRGAVPLWERLPHDDFDHTLISLGSDPARRLRPLPVPIWVVPVPARLNLLAAPVLSGVCTHSRTNLIHAWGLQAALTARLASNLPMVLTLFDAEFSPHELKLLRVLVRPSGFAVACGSETVRRRLVERGVPGGCCVVIRPGVDFGLLHRTRRSTLRRELGIGPDRYVAIVPEPVLRRKGQAQAFRAVQFVSHFIHDVGLILPGPSREQRRIVRLNEVMPGPPILICPGPSYPFEQLLAISDVLIVASPGDGSMTSVAWAMASGAAVIGAAGYAIAELIAHKLNGLLFKSSGNESDAILLARLLQDRDDHQRIREVARGQAYEVFSLRRYVDQQVQLYRNVLHGALPARDIVDPAIPA